MNCSHCPPYELFTRFAVRTVPYIRKICCSPFVLVGANKRISNTFVRGSVVPALMNVTVMLLWCHFRVGITGQARKSWDSSKFEAFNDSNSLPKGTCRHISNQGSTNKNPKSSVRHPYHRHLKNFWLKFLHAKNVLNICNRYFLMI